MKVTLTFVFVLALALNVSGLQSKKDWPLSIEKRSTVVLLLPLKLLQLEGTSVAKAEKYGVHVWMRDGRVIVGGQEEWQTQLSPAPNAFIVEKIKREKEYTEVELRNFATFVKLRFQPSITDIDPVFSQLVKPYDRASYPEVAVIVPGDQTYRYIFKMVKPAESETTVFEDANLRIEFSLSRFSFDFSLQNKTEGPIKLDWNQVAYVDPLGESHKVMHEGVRYIVRNEPMLPSIVPPGARITDVIVPTDLVDYKTGRSGGWEVEERLPKPELGQRFRGKTISFFVPLEVDGAVKNYNFVFSIDIGSEPKKR